ncbi:hypothetical protein ACFFGL_06515, partial [Mesonia maritima]
DGQAQFDLGALDNTIDGGASNVTVSYHASQAFANVGTPTLPMLYTTASTTVFARVESNSPAGCYNTVAVVLNVEDVPNLPASVPNLELCDTEQDGTREFDLTSQASSIAANEPNPGDYTLTYYASQTDLQNDTSIPGADLSAYENTSDPQTIYVEVEGTNACTSVITFDLIVNDLPSYNTPVELSICDDGSADGIASFNLNNATSQISSGFNNLVISYYETQAGADAGDPSVEPALPQNYTNGNPYNDTIYVRIEDSTTGCYTTDSLDLEVIASPDANPAGPLEVCEQNNSGTAQFNLSQLNGTINNNPNVTITYHANQADANAGTPTVPVSYTTASTTVFARVEDNSLACYNTIGITLTVLEQPNLPSTISPLEQCDTEGDGTREFDLTSQEGAILANEATSGDFTVSYYASVQDRSNG